MEVYSSFIYKYQWNWKQPRGHWVGEHINKLVHPDNGILYNMKKKWMNKPWENLKRLLQVKEVNTNRIHSVWFQLYNIQKQMYGNGKQDQWLPGVGVRRDEYSEHREFLE